MTETNRTAGTTGRRESGAVMTLNNNVHQQSSYGVSILIGLDAGPTGPKHVYGGTVPVATTGRRRAKNKMARRSRRINRVRGAR